MDAEKKDGRFVRSQIKRSAQLTDQEEQSLKAVARDCLAAVRALDAQRTALVQAARKGAGSSSASDAASPSQQLHDLWTQRGNTILSYVQQLKTALGDARFQHFDAFVRSTELPHIRVGKLAVKR